uniref:RING-type domain-containing protein n=1 Tax=Amphimedon queenslandica TaxID=400682 RepID=A0A1X7TRU7_AMPQE
MAQFSKEELSFVEDLPKHVEIECPVCFNILTDPHLVSCCGHNFCGSCIERVKASNGSCPMCKEKEYQAIPDKKCSRIINGLEVYCSNKEKGCQWKGELKNMSTHLSKEKREGECRYQNTKCKYKKCLERKQRRYLKCHEDKECPQRPFQCQYCSSKGTFLSITKDHYEKCLLYPVPCPNKCVSTKMPRGSLTAHINECPLEPVDCVFSWAGCNDKPLRKDVHVHTADTKHMTLLAVACGHLKKENELIKEEVVTLKCDTLNIHNAIADDPYPLLPIDITKGSEPVHFYTGACGRHMSARLMTQGNEWDGYSFMLFAFHEGQFDKSSPKLPKIFGKLTYSAVVWPPGLERAVKVDTDVPLIDDTEATYEQLHYHTLDFIISCEGTLPQGVIKTELKRYANFAIESAMIYLYRVVHYFNH